MGNTVAVWLVVIVAALAANLPFINERCFALLRWQRFSMAKPIWFRLTELIVLYFVVGGLAALLEASAGQRHVQTWEFYAVTGCLFLVLAFPGFVYRYLRRTHG